MPKFDESLEQMLDVYIYEEQQLLEQLDDILMRTEKEDTIAPDDVAEIFRIMHTVKGSSSMMGLTNLQKLAHAAEDLFSIIRDKPDIAYDKKILFDLVFQASDSMKSEIDILGDESAELTDFTQQIAKIRAYADVMKSADGQQIKSALPQEDIFTDDEGEDILTLKVKYAETCAMPSVRAMLLMRSLGKVCEVTKTIPLDINADNANDIITANGLYLKLITDDKDAVVNIAKKAIDVDSVEWVEKPKADPKPEPQPEQPAPQAAKTEQGAAEKKKSSPERGGGMMSVSLAKLDTLLDLVGEIVITESAVISSPDLKPFMASLDRFSTSARNLKKLTDELQDVVMSIRMVPVANAFSKMNRVVRDMNENLGKGVELVFVGQETEVDKSVVDILNDPLMHLVRNAVDHGIEAPEVRKQKGKTEKPTVTLSAENSSSEVIITVEDNGAGMDHNAILAKAKQKGILKKPESEYTKQEALGLIMKAGFSTNEQVTNYSGRGVGMDVVKQNLEKIGGKLIVESEMGVGSKFIIKIPLSLSINDVMQVAVGCMDLSVPISSVKEIFKADMQNIVYDTDGTQLIMIRGKCYPIISLPQYFGVESRVGSLDEGIMIFCEEEHKRVCLFADSLIGEQQIVTKPFSPILGQYNLNENGLSGCSILADGSMTLIADVGCIINKVFGK